MFGFHLGISGGMISMDSFLKFFYQVYGKENNIKPSNDPYCKFDSQILALFTSSLYLAALIASVFASFVIQRFGRRPPMICGGVFFYLGGVSVFCAFFRPDAELDGFQKYGWLLIVSRVFYGLGIGSTHQSLSMYIYEVARYQDRKLLNMIFPLVISIGIFAANVINYVVAIKEKGEAWRNSLRFEIFQMIYLICTFLLESPIYLIERGLYEKGKMELILIRKTTDVEEEFNNLMAANEYRAMKDPWISLLKRQYRPQLILAIAIPLFQQLTGINVIIFYAPILFKTIGFGAHASLMYAMIIGGCNVIATLVSIFTLNKKFGRRTLFLQGGIQMFICQILAIAYKFGLDGNVGILPKWYAIVVVCGICVYVAGFAWSWGSLGWLVPSEIFSFEVRSAAQSINVFVNMIFTFVIAQIFTTMFCHMKFGLFIFFACMLIVINTFIYKLLPETKDISIEEMHVIWQSHPYWKKFVKPIDITISDEF
ncbi:sugar transport protein 1-like [Vigna radiata var. radiata]|uniref:Sugar transport protein 1-like n=1 Tax=Vigna radiata var. radiata TaxID=3916 RepID=A0A3Q0EJP0_VIGRR|nr:sugar transport protein 1-like [Vigna radiata var. radiata]